MKIDEFCAQFGSHPRNVKSVVREWQVEEVDTLIKALHNEHDQLVGCGVIVSDALHGDGLLDQIPRELHDAFFNLMKKSARTYDEMRWLLLEKIRDDHGELFSFDDHHIVGFINKLKGQIGENLFQRHVGSAALLAPSGSQEGWDIAVRQMNGGYEYVQVKLYAEPSKVVEHMRRVNVKVAEGLAGIDGDSVNRIYFAVPEDIKADVYRLAEKHDLHSMVYEKSIPVNSADGARFVQQGLNNVGPEQLNHFLSELLVGVVAAGSLHAVVNGFLWYKGAKEFSDAFADTVASTALSTTGIAIGLVAETFCHTVALSGAVGISSRFLLGRFARSRWSFADYLDQSIARTENHIASLQQISMTSPICTGIGL